METALARGASGSLTGGHQRPQTRLCAPRMCTDAVTVGADDFALRHLGKKRRQPDAVKTEPAHRFPLHKARQMIKVHRTRRVRAPAICARRSRFHLGRESKQCAPRVAVPLNLCFVPFLSVRALTLLAVRVQPAATTPAAYFTAHVKVSTRLQRAATTTAASCHTIVNIQRGRHKGKNAAANRIIQQNLSEGPPAFILSAPTAARSATTAPCGAGPGLHPGWLRLARRCYPRTRGRSGAVGVALHVHRAAARFLTTPGQPALRA